MKELKFKCGHSLDDVVFRYTKRYNEASNLIKEDLYLRGVDQEAVCLKCEKIEQAKKAGLLDEKP